MRKFLLLLFSASLLTACKTPQTGQTVFTPRPQSWFLNMGVNNPNQTDRKLQISHARMNGNRIQLFVHVTDMRHFYHSGIPNRNWCNLTVNNIPVNGFTVNEFRDIPKPPTAYSLILDYSGSMGSARNVIYNVSQQLIQQKRPEDAYSVVRYASRSILDVPLTQNVNMALMQYGPSPMANIGELTATWDGLYQGISTLEFAPYPDKVAVVFTDGGENASSISQDWALWHAKKSGVRIVTISMGSGGAQNMMDLAKETGGMYTYLNNIQEFQQAYTDMQNKMQNYYLIEFTTHVIGPQTVNLSLCDGGALTASYRFNNEPLRPEPIREAIKRPLPPNDIDRIPVTQAGNTPVRQPDQPSQPTRRPIRQPESGSQSGNTPTSPNRKPVKLTPENNPSPVQQENKEVPQSGATIGSPSTPNVAEPTSSGGKETPQNGVIITNPSVPNVSGTSGSTGKGVPQNSGTPINQPNSNQPAPNQPAPSQPGNQGGNSGNNANPSQPTQSGGKSIPQTGGTTKLNTPSQTAPVQSGGKGTLQPSGTVTKPVTTPQKMPTQPVGNSQSQPRGSTTTPSKPQQTITKPGR